MSNRATDQQKAHPKQLTLRLRLRTKEEEAAEQSKKRKRLEESRSVEKDQDVEDLDTGVEIIETKSKRPKKIVSSETPPPNSITSSTTSQVPPGVDPEIFAQLPQELRQELLREHLSQALSGDSTQATGPEFAAAVFSSLASSLVSSAVKSSSSSSSSLASALVQNAIDLASEVEENMSVMNHGKLVFMTYNVWFAEEVALQQRMRAIVQNIKKYQPTFIGLQEVTPSIIRMLAKPLRALKYDVKIQGAAKQPYFVVLATRHRFKWCKDRSFQRTQMGRGLLFGAVECPEGPTVIVGTTHLESAVPPFHGPSMNTTARTDQLEECLTRIQNAREDENNPENVISVLMGDLNWNEGGRPYKRQPSKLTKVIDGPLPLPEGWVDTWSHLHPKVPFEDACTYDGPGNPMLANSTCFRPDRILLHAPAKFMLNKKAQKSQDKDESHVTTPSLQLQTVERIGTDPIPDASHERNGRELPVLPSDHYGVLASFKLTKV